MASGLRKGSVKEGASGGGARAIPGVPKWYAGKKSSKVGLCMPTKTTMAASAMACIWAYQSRGRAQGVKRHSHEDGDVSAEWGFGIGMGGAERPLYPRGLLRCERTSNKPAGQKGIGRRVFSPAGTQDALDSSQAYPEPSLCGGICRFGSRRTCGRSSARRAPDRGHPACRISTTRGIPAFWELSADRQKVREIRTLDRPIGKNSQKSGRPSTRNGKKPTKSGKSAL